MTRAELFNSAADLILQPGKWGQYNFAATIGDAYCHPQSTLAHRYCAAGALWHLTGDDDAAFNDAKAHLDRVCDELGDDDSIQFNDAPGRTAEQVAERLRLAAVRR